MNAPSPLPTPPAPTPMPMGGMEGDDDEVSLLDLLDLLDLVLDHRWLIAVITAAGLAVGLFMARVSPLRPTDDPGLAS